MNGGNVDENVGGQSLLKVQSFLMTSPLWVCTESFWMSRSVNFISFVLSLFLLSLHCF